MVKICEVVDGCEDCPKYGDDCDGDKMAELERQAEIFADYAKKKRRWENAFQKWSNEQGIENYGNTEDYGCCGCGIDTIS